MFIFFNFYTARRYFISDLAYLRFDLTFSQLETESLQAKEKKRIKEKHALLKETVKCFIGNFSATSCCKNHLKTLLFLAVFHQGFARTPDGLQSKPFTLRLRKFVILKRLSLLVCNDWVRSESDQLGVLFKSW